MKVTKIKSIFKKEMMDLLRDKKTLIMMVLVPLVLYPLIFMVAILVASSVTQSIEKAEYKVGIVVENTSTNSANDFGNINNVDKNVDKNTNINTADSTYSELFDYDKFVDFIEDKEDEFEYNIEVVAKADEESLLAEEIDAIVSVNTSGDTVDFTISYMSSVTNSSAVSDMIEDKLHSYKQYLEVTKLELMGLDSEYIMEPINIDWVDVSNDEERLGNILGTILPFLLITSILMGAVYPAIDTTAGEKERGTLETLLTLPVRNDELIMGKFLAVALVAVISAVLNLISMGIMAGFLFTLMQSNENSSSNVNLLEFIPAILVVVLCVVAFAMFISAVTMCVTTFAKSYKEANNYVTPLLLVVMLTGYIGFIPNIEFTPVLASIPVVNICLLITNILVFKYNFYLIAIVLLTNIAYAVLAIWMLAKLYNSEEILFSEGGVSLQILSNRKDLKKGGVPTVSDAALVIAVTMLLLLYLGTLVQLKNVIVGMVFIQFLIISMPVFATWYTKKDFKETFSIKKPKVMAVIGAIILEIGMFMLIQFVSLYLQKIFPTDAESVSSSFEAIFEKLPVWGATLIIALAPAICEESLFRGYTLSAAKNKFKPWQAILIVAAIFGIYHMSFIKFFTTGLLGAGFAFVCHMSGSIVPGMIMHFLNNFVSVLIVYYETQVREMLPWLFEENLSIGSYIVFVVVGIICTALGIWMQIISRKSAANK